MRSGRGPPGKHCSPELNVLPPGCRVAARPPPQQGQGGQSRGLHPPLRPGASPARVAGLCGAQGSERAGGGSPVLPSPASWRPLGPLGPGLPLTKPQVLLLLKLKPHGSVFFLSRSV